MILVVDDDPGLCALVATVLDATGCEIREAATGEEALAAARSERPTLVVLDVCLPGIGGYSVLRELRDAYGEELPIVLLSGERTDALDSASGLLLGADDYVCKPFNPDELLARVRRCLSRAGVRASSPQRSKARELTPREREVLALLAGGLGQVEISQDLVITEKTVETHIQRILSKLGVHSRAHAVAVAHRDGLVALGAPLVASPSAR